MNFKFIDGVDEDEETIGTWGNIPDAVEGARLYMRFKEYPTEEEPTDEMEITDEDNTVVAIVRMDRRTTFDIKFPRADPYREIRAPRPPPIAEMKDDERES